MKSKIFLGLMVLILVVGTMLAGCAEPAPAPTPTPTPAPAPTPAAAPDEVIELIYFHHDPPFMPTSKFLAEKWGPEVEKRTEGRVKITFYFAGTLGKAADEWEMVKTGVGDITNVFGGYFPGLFPMTILPGLPFIWPCEEQGLCQSIAEEVFDKYIYQEWSEVKVLWLTVTYPGTELMTSKKPVRVLEDFEGMQIGTPPGPIAKMVGLLGGTPSVVPTPEAYMAIERGMTDGHILPSSALNAFKIHEASKYLTLAHFTCTFSTRTMNLEKWNSLPADIQKILDETSVWAAKGLGEVSAANNERTLQIFKEAGIELISLAPEERARWVEATKPMHDAWIEQKDADGLPATEAYNLIQQRLAAGK